MIPSHSEVGVTVITVTYGERWRFLRETIASCLREGATNILVIDNGTKYGLRQLLEDNFPGNFSLVEMGSNKGSALGYKRGFEEFMKSGLDYALLMDDDNVLLPGALANLWTAYFEKTKELSPELIGKTAVIGFRRDHQSDVAAGVNENRINFREGSWFGFHFFDIPYKIWRRLNFVKKAMQARPVKKFIKMTVAPWSGLFISRELISHVGLPNENFVLYGDDTEYTWRITESGGGVYLCTDALIEDIDKSWNVKSRSGNSIDGLLSGASDFRLYYSVRNQAYLELMVYRSGWQKYINRYIYIGLMRFFAIFRNKSNKFKLIEEAIRDGESGRLGASTRYPI